MFFPLKGLYWEFLSYKNKLGVEKTRKTELNILATHDYHLRYLHMVEQFHMVVHFHLVEHSHMADYLHLVVYFHFVETPLTFLFGRTCFTWSKIFTWLHIFHMVEHIHMLKYISSHNWKFYFVTYDELFSLCETFSRTSLDFLCWFICKLALFDTFCLLHGIIGNIASEKFGQPNFLGYFDGNRVEHLDSGWGFHSNPYLLKGLK